MVCLLHFCQGVLGKKLAHQGKTPQWAAKLNALFAFLDHDGVYEIKCCQYTSLYGHSDFVGSAVSFLKYDKEKSAFIICDAYFEAEKIL